MADRENGVGDSEQKDDAQRPVSAGSKASGDSKKSIVDTVSKLTVKALKEFRLSDPSDVDTTITGAESEGLVPTANLTQDVPTLDLHGGPGATILSEQEGITDFGEHDAADEFGVEEDGDDITDDEESDGESEMVVLDPDHVSYCYL